MNTRTRRFVRHGVRALLIGWAVALVVVGASLMVGHWSTLPRPELEDETLVAELNALRGPDDDGWLAVHVLYAECRCSQRIFDHLLASTRPEGVAEKVIVVGEHAFAHDAPARGFGVVTVTPRELATRFRVESAPMLLIVAPDGAIRYAGGYTQRKQGLELEDVELIERSVREQAVAELPLFGCGVSKRLQMILDPLRVKYSETDR